MNAGTPTTEGDARRVALPRIVATRENAILVLVLIVLILGFGLASGGKTLGVENLTNVVTQSATRGIAAIGQMFVVLTAGIDISIAGIGVFCAMLASVLMTDSFQNLTGTAYDWPLVILIVLAVGGLWGSINGFLIARLRIPALIVTLGMWQVALGATFLLSSGRSVASLPEGFAEIGQGEMLGISNPTWIFIAVAVAAYIVLYHTSYGRRVYAVGGNERSAWLSGIPVVAIVFSVYVISGVLAATAGLIETSRTVSASMDTVGGLELDTIAAIAIGGVSLAGGRGSLVGVVIGALIIGVINNGMSVMGAGPALENIVKGAIIVAAVGVDFRRSRRN